MQLIKLNNINELSVCKHIVIHHNIHTFNFSVLMKQAALNPIRRIYRKGSLAECFLSL